MNNLEPKRPRGNVYKGTAYYKWGGERSPEAALTKWRQDWMRWARREIKRLREK